MKLFKNWWGRFLFRDRGIVPTFKLLFILLIAGLLITVLSLLGASWIFVGFLNAVILLISLVDLFFSPNRKQLDAKRMMPQEMERYAKQMVVVEVNNYSKFPCEMHFVDGIPTSFQTIFPVNQKITPGKNVIDYHVFPLVRGKYVVEKLYVRYKSLFGLWEKQITFKIEETVKVIPNLTEAKRYLASSQRYLLHEGLKIRKQKSGIGEFAKVRNYVVGDDPRKINWRQSAKLQEVMTNDYEPEHGKYVTILIDCGRMMGVELQHGNRLEKVIEAAITVAAAALKNGDYVSVVAFSKEIKAYVPPAKGLDHLDVILKSIYHIQVDASESNYVNVLQYLQTVQKKRSLFLLFSDVHTFIHEDHTLLFIKRVRKRHLFMMIGIEDELLMEKIKTYPETQVLAMEKTMAQKEAQFKKQQVLKWDNQGIIMLEAPEDKLAVTAVSHYINLLNRGLL